MITLTDYTIVMPDVSGDGEAVFHFDTDNCGEMVYTVDYRVLDGVAEVQYSDFTVEVEACNIEADGDTLNAHRIIQDTLDAYILEDIA